MADTSISEQRNRGGQTPWTNLLIGLVLVGTAGLCYRSFKPSCVNVCEPTVPTGAQVDTAVVPPGDTAVAPPGDSVRLVFLRRRAGG